MQIVEFVLFVDLKHIIRQSMKGANVRIVGFRMKKTGKRNEVHKRNIEVKMQEQFQPILVSWRIPEYPYTWCKYVCRRKIELEYFRANLQHVKYYEQRIYSV